MGRKLIAVEAPDQYLAVTWQVNNFCNFSCSYCNPGNWAGANPNNGNLDIYLNNLRVIINKYKDAGYKNFKFFFSGGEPTAWRNFIPICEFLRAETDCTIAVNTNLSRPLAWWEKHHHLFDDLVASFHVEHTKKERYIENTMYLCDKVNYLSSKMLMHDERFWEVVEFGNSLKEILPNYFIEWTPLYDELNHVTGPWKYNDPAKEEFFKTHTIEMKQTLPKPDKRGETVSYSKYDDDSSTFCNANELIVNGQNFFSGWKCSVGDCIFINPVGDVSLASCGQTGVVGHILDDISQVGPKEITCFKEMCMCGTDIIIPKFNPNK